MSHRSLFALLLCLVLFISCGKDTEEEVADAVLRGNQLLSSGKCDEAIRVLEEVGRRAKNARYLVVLSSAYACQAGYSELTLFEKDIGKTGNPPILGGFTRFTTSNDVTDIDETEYRSLKEAIKILLFRGQSDDGKNSSILDREDKLGSVGAAELHAMLLYEIMVQLGRFLQLYGNPDANGVKGGGTATDSNSCLIEYDGNIPLEAPVNDLQTHIEDPLFGGECNSLSDGNSTLGTPSNHDIPKMCDGVVMVNNFLNLVPEVLSNFAGDELSELDDISTQIQDARDKIKTLKPSLSDILNVTSFQKCIDDNAEPNTNAIQIYYGVLFEELFQ